MLHQKLKGATTLTASEAVVELFICRNREGGTLLIMERAEPHQIGSGPLEFNMPANDFSKICSRQNFIQKCRWKVSHGYLIKVDAWV